VSRIRELARQALVERRPEPSLDAEVERVVVDVRIGDRVETVSLALRDHRLVVVASDGATASSPAARAALEWLTAEPLRTSLPPAARRDREQEPIPPADQAVEAALSDLVAAIARTGVAAEAPAIADALGRLGASGDSVVERWVGRLRAALVARDESVVGRLVDGGRHLLAVVEPTRLVDHTLVEVARELVDGRVPSSIERRHLLDLTEGRWLVEEHGRDTAASNGPCPRSITAGLALSTSAGRVRIVQYAVGRVDEALRARVEALACPRVDDAYARDVASLDPSLLAVQEPCSLVTVQGVVEGLLRDAAGDPIPLARHEDPGGVSALLQLMSAPPAGVRWLFGRWALMGDEISLVPLSCSVDGRWVRLR
jgi:hypothetical protein